jgi:hypothetical protein
MMNSNISIALALPIVCFAMYAELNASACAVQQGQTSLPPSRHQVLDLLVGDLVAGRLLKPVVRRLDSYVRLLRVSIPAAGRRGRYFGDAL